MKYDEVYSIINYKQIQRPEIRISISIESKGELIQERKREEKRVKVREFTRVEYLKRRLNNLRVAISSISNEG